MDAHERDENPFDTWMNAHPARALLSAGDLMQEVRRHGVAGDELPVLSGLTVTVPGTAMAWEDTLKSFGRLPMAQVCPSCLVCLIALRHCRPLSKRMLIGQRMRCTHVMKSCPSRSSFLALLSSVHVWLLSHILHEQASLEVPGPLYGSH